MTLSELLDELLYLASTTGDDPEVRVAYQPTYPLRATLSNVTIDKDCDNKEFLWLAAGTSVPYNENPYAPSKVWEDS